MICKDIMSDIVIGCHINSVSDELGRALFIQEISKILGGVWRTFSITEGSCFLNIH